MIRSIPHNVCEHTKKSANHNYNERPYAMSSTSKKCTTKNVEVTVNSKNTREKYKVNEENNNFKIRK